MAAEQSFMKALFHGVIAEEMVLPYPELRGDERDLVHLLLDDVRTFHRTHVDSAHIDQEASLGPELLTALRERGLLGLCIPASHGGRGLSYGCHTRLMQELGALDPSIATTILTHQALAATAIELFGTEAQRRRWLPRMASGECVGAFALTEQASGSDPSTLQTTATRDGDHWVLRGQKTWVTNGAFADLFVLFARTNEGSPGARPQLLALLVERDAVRVVSEEPKLGLRATSTAVLALDGARVPVGNQLGDPGKGFRVAMEALSIGRLAMAGICVGMCRELTRLTVQRARTRMAFGRPIGEFGFIKDKVARMLTETYALESMVYLTAGLLDARVEDTSLESAVCKIFGAETLWRVANEALQVAASAGYSQRAPFERSLRDARAFLVMHGTPELLRAFVALAGMQGPGRRLSDVSRAMREPIKGFGLLTEFALKRARSALGRERLDRAHGSLRRETVLFEQYTAQLANQVEKVLRKHGAEIAEMQYTQRRVADIAVDLYALVALLSRTTRAIERKGEDGARRELDLSAAFSNGAERRLRGNVAAFDDNDDELLKSIAARSYTDGGYPFDVV